MSLQEDVERMAEEMRAHPTTDHPPAVPEQHYVSERMFDYNPDDDPGANIPGLSGIFSALAHPGRLEVLLLLCDYPCSPKYIAQTLDIPLSTLSRHLAALERTALVAVEKQGREKQYSPGPRSLELLQIAQKIGN